MRITLPLTALCVLHVFFLHVLFQTILMDERSLASLIFSDGQMSCGREEKFCGVQ